MGLSKTALTIFLNFCMKVPYYKSKKLTRRFVRKRSGSSIKYECFSLTYKTKLIKRLNFEITHTFNKISLSVHHHLFIQDISTESQQQLSILRLFSYCSPFGSNFAQAISTSEAVYRDKCLNQCRCKLLGELVKREVRFCYP